MNTKQVITLLFSLVLTSAVNAEMSLDTPQDSTANLENVSLDEIILEAEEDDSSILSPEDAEEYFLKLENQRTSFPQTRWFECSDDISGNFKGFNCSNKRGIAVILEEFKNRNFEECVNNSLAKVGKPKAMDLHVIHNGIQGDTNHSSRSLHSVARAVDVDSFEVTYSSGASERISFKSSSNNKFFNEFRSCWGKAVNQQNGCPLISGRYDLTGSIGKEDSRHQNHMHVSVPYCISGNYSSQFFRR